MRSLQQARQRARACRDAMGNTPEDLLERVIRYLLDIHGIDYATAPSSDTLAGEEIARREIFTVVRADNTQWLIDEWRSSVIPTDDN